MTDLAQCFLLPIDRSLEAESYTFTVNLKPLSKLFSVWFDAMFCIVCTAILHML
jgi:hypothetical protein